MMCERGGAALMVLTSTVGPFRRAVSFQYAVQSSCWRRYGDASRAGAEAVNNEDSHL